MNNQVTLKLKYQKTTFKILNANLNTIQDLKTLAFNKFGLNAMDATYYAKINNELTKKITSDLDLHQSIADVKSQNGKSVFVVKIKDPKIKEQSYDEFVTIHSDENTIKETETKSIAQTESKPLENSIPLVEIQKSISEPKWSEWANLTEEQRQSLKQKITEKKENSEEKKEKKDDKKKDNSIVAGLKRNDDGSYAEFGGLRHEVIGPSDKAYGHTRLLTPNLSKLKIMWANQETKPQSVKIELFAPWKMNSCWVIMEAKGLQKEKVEIKSEDQGRTYHVINLPAEIKDNEVTVNLVWGEGVLFLGQVDISNASDEKLLKSSCPIELCEFEWA